MSKKDKYSSVWDWRDEVSSKLGKVDELSSRMQSMETALSDFQNSIAESVSKSMKISFNAESIAKDAMRASKASGGFVILGLILIGAAVGFFHLGYEGISIVSIIGAVVGIAGKIKGLL